MAQVLPKELRLGAPPTMPRARSYLFKQQSAQTTYSPGQTIQINLPRLQRSYLTKDSYLKFAVQFSGTAVAGTTDGTGLARYPWCWDTIGANGLIDKIEVYDYLGSTLLESTAGHGQLLTLLMDMGSFSEEYRSHYNTTQGMWSNGPTGTFKSGTTALALAGAAGTVLKDADVYDTSPPTGAPIIDSGTTTLVTREYAIPLFSFLGLLSTKFAPLHNGYTINITLNPMNIAAGNLDINNSTFISGGGLLTAASLGSSTQAPVWTIRDIYLCSQVLELGGEAEALLQQSTGGGAYIVPTKAFRNYIGSFAGSTSTYRLDLNLNVASLTNILWMMRPTSYINGYQRSLSDRVRNYLQSWYFQYGSSILPQTSGIQCRSKNTVPTYGQEGALTTDAIVDIYDHSEAYNELIKSRHAFNRPTHCTTINTSSFTQDEVPTKGVLWARNTTPTSKFACGLDLELVSGRSNDMICGMNTNGMNTSIYATFDTNNKAAKTVPAARVDAWCEYDAFINVLPGVASTVSF